MGPPSKVVADRVAVVKVGRIAPEDAAARSEGALLWACFVATKRQPETHAAPVGTSD